MRPRQSILLIKKDEGIIMERKNVKKAVVKSDGMGIVVATGREMIEGGLGVEAVKRIGKNPQLKGVVHEIMKKEAYNSNPKHLFDGTKAVLSKSTTAVRDDILIKKGAKIVGRMQLKDISKSIPQTIKQVKSGHYSGTQLMGTNETVAAYEKAVKAAAKKGTQITQKMKSTGISSSDTSRIATKTIGTTAGKISAGAVGKVAASSGAVGAAISGGMEVCLSGMKLKKGEITGKEFAGNVARETVGGGLSAAGGSAAATLAATGVATALATTAAPVWIPAAVGVGAAIVVGGAIKGVWDFGCKKVEKSKKNRKNKALKKYCY